MKRTKSLKTGKPCPACVGKGLVCCETWAYARLSSGADFEFNELGMPLWPFVRELEMPLCPFCGQRFQPRRLPMQRKKH